MWSCEKTALIKIPGHKDNTVFTPSCRYRAERLADCWTRARPFMWPVELPSASSLVKTVTYHHSSYLIMYHTVCACHCVCVRACVWSVVKWIEAGSAFLAYQLWCPSSWSCVFFLSNWVSSHDIMGATSSCVFTSFSNSFTSERSGFISVK